MRSGTHGSLRDESSTAPVLLGNSHETPDGPIVLADGERMLVAPGLFARESRGSPGGSSGLHDALQNAESISATLDTVVLEDGEVLGPDASRMVDSLRAGKTAIDALVGAVLAADRNGQDGVEVLRQFARPPRAYDEASTSWQVRGLAHSLMIIGCLATYLPIFGNWLIRSQAQHLGGGEGGIRTRGKVAPTHAFQACSLNHSDTSPHAWFLNGGDDCMSRDVQAQAEAWQCGEPEHGLMGTAGKSPTGPKTLILQTPAPPGHRPPD